MPNQDNPSTHQLRVRITEDLFRALEILAARRGYPDVSSLVRALVIEATSEIVLSSDDYRLIADRVAAREEALRG